MSTEDKKKKRKLFQIAKELNLSSHTIKEFLEKKGLVIKNPNMAIPDDMYDEILKRFSHEKKEAEKVQKRRLDRIREEKIAALEKEESHAEEEPELPSARAKADQEIKEKEFEKKETIIELSELETRSSSLEKEPSETTLEQQIETHGPSDSEIAAKETPTEEMEKKEAEIKKPAVGDIINHPMAMQFLKKQKEEEELKKSRRKKAIKSIKDKADEEHVVEKPAGEEEIAMDENALAEEKRKREKKKEKKRGQFETEEERDARRKKAFEMIRREGKKFRTSIHNLEMEEEEPSVTPDREGRKKRGKKKKEVDHKEVEDVLKKTLAEMKEVGTGKKRRKKVKDQIEDESTNQALVKVSEFMTTQDLANLMDIEPSEIIRKCLELGLKVTINQRLDLDTIHLLAEEFGFRVEEEEEFGSEFLEEIIEEEGDGEEQPRHPVVTVMGHVDHGKTSLLDYLRKANVVAGESGGITQHIGAYELVMDNGRKITFVDTPGHEAFTAMRARGAQVTDIVVLVVAADDKVMPQTEEAIDHAKAAGVPIVIAINKIDKHNSNPEAVRKDLAGRNILVEDWGGSFQVANVSAKTGEGIPELLEKILLEAELLDLKARSSGRANGVVLESFLDKGKGPVATILVQSGTLRIADFYIVGQYWGRVRALLNERGQKVKSAGPSSPVQLLGTSHVPEAGDRFVVMPNEKTARDIASRRQQLRREQDFRKVRLMTLDDFSKRAQFGELKELRLLVKADVDGSAQALVDSLQKLENEDVDVEVIRRALGPITESDVMLAAASQAIIIGFHVRPTINAKELAERENVDIRLYKIIYDAIDDIKKALEGLLEPLEREEIQGTVEVREIFKISRLGTIAGCYVLSGKINRNSRLRLIRNDVEIYDGRLSSLKRFKEDVKELQSGFECGLMIENYNDIKQGDIIEVYEVVHEMRTLDKATSN
jgi:translation initiation factor IF-2